MPCPVSGNRHSWWKLGLDIVRGKLVYRRRCSFCGAEKSVPYKGR